MKQDGVCITEVAKRAVWLWLRERERERERHSGIRQAILRCITPNNTSEFYRYNIATANQFHRDLVNTYSLFFIPTLVPYNNNKPFMTINPCHSPHWDESKTDYEY